MSSSQCPQDSAGWSHSSEIVTCTQDFEKRIDIRWLCGPISLCNFEYTATQIVGHPPLFPRYRQELRISSL